MSKKKLIEEDWELFERETIPPNVSEIQRHEMRRAFYAGTQVVLSRLRYLRFTRAKPQQYGETLYTLDQECHEFTKQISTKKKN